MRGVHHISLKAGGEAEFQAALDFYGTVLGCSLVRLWGQGERRGAMLDLGIGSGPMDHGFDIHSAFAEEA